MLKYKQISECRCCGSKQLNELIDLGELAFSGLFPVSTDENIMGRLRLVSCDATIKGNCGLVQLDRDFDQALMYGSSYGYRSGLNAQMVNHLKEKVKNITKFAHLTEGAIVLDIGSNDGTTLSFFGDKLRKIGIDPTISKFGKYYPEDIIKVPHFFTKDKFKDFFGEEKARVVTSFSMFYDLPKPIEFAQNVADILDPRFGIWVLEQSDLRLMLETNSFDTICHEHSEYYSFTTLNYIFERVGLHVIDIEFNEVNGGSSSITVAHKSSQFKVHPKNVSMALAKENLLIEHPAQVFNDFKGRFSEEIRILKAYLEDGRKRNKKIAGLGASTKGNILLQYASISTNELPYIGEVNEDKFGKYTPGTFIPIVSEDWLIAQGYDEFLVLPWHFQSFFLKLEKLSGSKLIFALPAYKQFNV